LLQQHVDDTNIQGQYGILCFSFDSY